MTEKNNIISKPGNQSRDLGRTIKRPTLTLYEMIVQVVYRGDFDNFTTLRQRLEDSIFC